MSLNKNKLKDNFNYLESVRNDINTLKTKVNSILNKFLPNRVLSKANIFNLTIDIVQDLTKLTMLQIEDALVEQNIMIAQKELSVRGLATLQGHQAVRPTSSEGVLKLTFLPSAFQQSPVLVFQDLLVKCDTNGLTYICKNENFNVSSSLSTLEKFIEGRWVTNELKANGDKLEIINLDDVSPIENNNIKVFVNGIEYKRFDSLYDMKTTDLGYLIKNGIGNQVDIIFGDNVYGKQLEQGDTITIQHLITNGELGNIQNLQNATFSIIEGAYDINGNVVNLNDSCKITAYSGFVLGSNGENIELTRQLSGYVSKSMVFVRPENLKAYLSRLSLISYVDVWGDFDKNVYNVLCLPNIMNRINQYKDYLYVTDFKFTDNQKNSIIEYIDGSQAQKTTSELVWVDPQFMKYVCFVYVSGDLLDKAVFKSKVENVISEVFIKQTLVGETQQNIITQNMIIDSVLNIDGVKQCNIDMFSEQNELARINGVYTKQIDVYNGATKTQKNIEVFVQPNENPNLGFDELGGILLDDKKQIPLLRGGFRKYSDDGEHFLMDSPIYIFYKNSDGDFEAII